MEEGKKKLKIRFVYNKSHPLCVHFTDTVLFTLIIVLVNIMFDESEASNIRLSSFNYILTLMSNKVILILILTHKYSTHCHTNRDLLPVTQNGT